MMHFTKKSKWIFDTSNSAGVGLGLASVAVGSFTLSHPPTGRQSKFIYESAGAGASEGLKLPRGASASFSSQEFKSSGEIWLTPGFTGTDLTADDITGFATIVELSTPVGSRSAVFFGVDIQYLAPEGVKVAFSMSPVGLFLNEAVGIDWPDVMQTKANGVLLIAGAGIGTCFGATQSTGHVRLGTTTYVPVEMPSPPKEYPDIPVRVIGKETIVELGGDVLFCFDEDILRPAAQRVLNEVGKRIKTVGPSIINVWGYTDSTGTDAYNYNLSMRRATRVAKWFVTNGYIADSKIKPSGFGKTHAVQSNQTEAGRSKNRRVEVRLYK